MSLIKGVGGTLKALHWRLLATMRHEAAVGPVFVVGTGRSGTHFLARTLITHRRLDDLVGGRENPFVFSRVQDLASSPETSASDVLDVLKRYRVLSAASQPQILVDQSHPNLWLVSHLVSEFPGAKFLALIRDPISVAYSTGQHIGVRKWLEPPYPVPVQSLFVGNRNGLFADYDKLSLYEKSAIRWASHVVKTCDLVSQLSEHKIITVSYEDLCLSPGQTLQDISDFLGIDNSFEMPAVNERALRKKDLVPEQDVLAVKQVLRKYFDAYPIYGRVKNIVGRYL